MKIRKKFLVLALAIASLTACSNQPQTGPSDDEATSEESTQINDTNEATEVTEEKDPQEDSELAEEFNGQILYAGSSTLAPVITAIGEEFSEEYKTWDKFDSSLPSKDIGIFVSSGGSGQGVKAVIDKTSDFGMVSRNVKDEEIEKMDKYQEFKIGVDALTLAVSKDNPLVGKIDNLSKNQIIALFSGEYPTWKDLDASLPDEEVVVITRDINGGAHGVFQDNIMGDVQVKQDTIQAASMGELVQNVISNPYAIGYASFGVAKQNKDNIFTLKVDGVEASKETILDGSYVIQRPLLLIKDGDLNPAEKAFTDLILGEKGQAIIEESGFIPAN